MDRGRFDWVGALCAHGRLVYWRSARRNEGGSVVGRCLNVRLGQWQVETVNDRREDVSLGLDREGEDVSDSQVNSLLVKIVLKNNKALVELGRVFVKNLLEAGEGRLAGCATADNVPVGSVKGVALVSRPHDRSETHLCGNSTHAVVDVTIGRAESVGSYTDDILDSLLGPTKLGDDLLVCKRRKSAVGPCVDGKLVAGHVL